jgi:hypothetical protein
MSCSAVWYFVKCAITKFARTVSNVPLRNGRSMTPAAARRSPPSAARACTSIPAPRRSDHVAAGRAAAVAATPSRSDVEHALSAADAGDRDEVASRLGQAGA